MCLKKCLKHQAVTVNDVYLLRVVRMPGGVVATLYQAKTA